MLVHVISETASRISRVTALLAGEHTVSSSLLSNSPEVCADANALIVLSDLCIINNIVAIKNAIASARSASRRIFHIDNSTHRCVSQAYALGATHVLIGGIKRPQLLRLLSHSDPTAPTNSGQGAANDAAAAMTAMFQNASDGTAIDLGAIKQVTHQVVDQIGDKGLSNWLEAVRRHHQGTYQHCLLVTGLATDFGLSLGMSRSDVERLCSAALFHDIGKAQIPLAILDKPERLTCEERAIIETHPAAGYAILTKQNGVSSEILDAVRHHHELLDGTGYPDRLSGKQISDLVRMLTISDIFAALIEKRSYKATMSRPEGYAVLCDMEGKLERALVRAFKPVALDR
ncbi:HD-GYP domain-containing protein [Bradyrhizobium japonicum]|uniref:HD-GYP domain-containing protein n=1 Tax=Bradyrhizobium japonicum TaxID=375 RepID=UPI0027146A24|nr:HD domain-containing phosphohydrolase [Bradyrhizobium japonicum]WLB23992.1 HD domain-containing protein [Bradyrhizobium japonicum]